MVNSVLNKYYQFLYYKWPLLAPWFQSCLISISVFILGITIKGEWILLLAHWFRVLESESEARIAPADLNWSYLSLKYYNLQHLPMMWFSSMFAGFAIWFIVGGFLQWHFYYNQSDQADEWKCQPRRWLTPQQERSEFLWGCVGLLTTNTGSAFIATYIKNGGFSTLYYNFHDYSLLWYFLQWPILFIFQDYGAYWAHRIHHMPFLYTRFHKIHHRFKAPTCWSVTAFHPIDIFSMQLVLAAPMIYLPVHWTTFVAVGLYTYYNAILDHSGVDIKAPFWQFWKPDSIFHDNHHQYTHVNYGFNCYYWDMFHGTSRKTDHMYKEDIYYGYGVPLSMTSEKELEMEMEERKAENLKAHRQLNNILL